MLFGSAPVVLVITLLALVYLSFLELRKRPLPRMVKLAWLLFVFLTHAFGFLALLAYLHLLPPAPRADLSIGPAPESRRPLPPRRTVIVFIAILFVAAFVVSRSCQKREVAIDKERAVEIARDQIDYEPQRVAVRFMRRGVPSRGYWAVSMPGTDPPRVTTVVISASSGDVVEVNREQP